jgi:hypothetical protein
MTLRPAALFLALAMLVPPAAPAAAEDPAMPERRLIVVAGQDFPGGDIRSIMDTEIGFCREACLAEASCKAFTFNERAGACFLKSGVTSFAPYRGALSAIVVDAPAELRAQAEARLRDLAFLPEWTLASARRQALAIGLSAPVPATTPEELTGAPRGPAAAGNSEAALAAQASEVSRSDTAGAWLAYARIALGVQGEEWRKAELRDVALAAAVNAYLRAGKADERAAALVRMADVLERQGQGRLMVPALRLAQAVAPDPATAEALDRAINLYGFRIAEHSVDSDSALPRICLTFSEPLAAAGIDYAPFIRMPGPALPVEVEAERLCIEGVQHGGRYAFTVREGLPAANGETLARSVDLEVYVRDRAPSVRFTGRAYVLPKSADAAIPVVTVNMSEVALAIYRIGDRNLMPALQDGLLGATLNGWSTSRIESTFGEKVWEGTGAVERRVNEDVTTALPLGEAVSRFRPGIYAMTARVPGRGEYWEDVATQWFVVTDLGLSTLKGADGLHVFVRSLASAAALPGVKLQLIAANNEVLGEAVTGAEGYALFAPGLTRGTGGNEPALIAAAAGEEDFAFLSLRDAAFDLSDRGVEGRPAPPPIDVFLSTERGAYRPGETIFATILARDTSVDAIGNLPLTAILVRPDGMEQQRVLLADRGAGGRVFSATLAQTAMRGTWTLRIHADPDGPALASANVAVEDFEPERIDFTLTMAEDPVSPEAPPGVAVAARYLYGAPGGGLRIEGETAVTASRTIEAFPGYQFGVEGEFWAPRAETVPADLLTDAEGNATVPLALPPLDPTTLPLTMITAIRLAEGSGRPVERTLTRPLLPAQTLIGVRPLFDGVAPEGATAGFEVIAVGAGLARTALPRVGWTLSRLETDWQWYRMDGSWNWEPVTRRERIATGEIALAPDRPGRIEAPVAWGNYELRLVALDGSPSAATLTFWAGWYAPRSGTDTPDVLAVGLDRESYRPGDTARLRLTARDPGTVLVRVVTDRLVAMQAAEVPAGESELPLEVTEAWGPGAYVTATLIRPMDAPARRNPTRAIGIAWAGIDPGSRKLAARFTTAEEADPRGPLEAALQVEGLAPGEEAWATIAAVDVGVLNITGFTAPDPVGHYFGQRRLGMEMRDLYGRLIDGLQGDPGRLRSGGDGGLNRNAAPPTQELVAYFAGPVKVGPDGTARATFDLPDFNGTVRLMAVVWSERGVGQAEKDVLVRDPVVVATSGPRFLAPGDETRLQIELAHATGPAGKMQVAVEADAGLELRGGTLLTVTLPELGRERVGLRVAATGVGDPSIRIAVTTPDGTVLRSRYTLPVRANDPEIARSTRLTLRPRNGSFVLDANAFEGIVPGTGRATLALGPLARFDAPGLLAALDAYPHGCTEQLTSRAYPLLYLDQLAAALGLGDRDRTRERVAEAIAAILENQSGAGSFGLWRPEEGDLWLDSYVTDFLSRARALGHPVPDTSFRIALDNLRNRVNYAPDFESGGEDIAYALMVLARENAAAIGDLRYYADVKANAFATPLAKAQLGLALAYYGDQPRADALFRLAAAGLDDSQAEDKVWRVDFGSRARDAAAVLTLAVEARSEAVDRDRLARIATPRGLSLWHRSTQENMWTLLAANALVEAAAEGRVLLDGVPMTGPLVRLLEQGTDRHLTVTNTGETPVEAVLTTFGVPSQPEPASGDGYRIAREYFTLAGEPVDLRAVPRSQRIVAVVTVTPERMSDARLIVSDPLPAGFEIENPNLLRSGDIAALGWLDLPEVARHTEFRSDRFVAAVDWSGESPFRLAYVVRAISPGRYHHPAASVEDMYRPEFRARTGTDEVTVTAE